MELLVVDIRKQAGSSIDW